MDPARMLDAARDALTIVVERYARLVECQPDTSIPIPGSEWTLRDAAVHLAGSNHRHATLVQGGMATAETLDKEYLDARARRLIAEHGAADGVQLAGQIRDGYAQLTAVMAETPADQPISYHAGLRPSLARMVCVVLGEYLLHGYDIATAAGVPWPIDADHAALAVGAYRMTYALTFQPAAAAGLEATYRLDVPGTDPFFVRIAEGRYEEPAAPPSVDCVIAADPVAALLVHSRRLSQWAAIVLGRYAFSGEHPELGPRFAPLFVFP